MIGEYQVGMTGEYNKVDVIRGEYGEATLQVEIRTIKDKVQDR